MKTDGVERDDGGAPSAFRIWGPGANATDYGDHIFSRRSAELLMTQQARRGNLFSIDVDHLSFNPQAPPSAHVAVGWHRLETRNGEGGPELWAVDVQWADEVRAGLEKDPPEWRYFSPAYDVDPKTSEIVGYRNTAITNNPATWSVTALASSSSRSAVFCGRAAALPHHIESRTNMTNAERAIQVLATAARGGDRVAVKQLRAMANNAELEMPERFAACRALHKLGVLASDLASESPRHAAALGAPDAFKGHREGSMQEFIRATADGALRRYR